MSQMRVHGQVCLDRRNIYSTEKLVNIRIEWIICYVCMYVCGVDLFFAQSAGCACFSLADTV
jgi:hypothetical protein